MTFRLATWNVNSLKVRLPHLIDWLARAKPDAVCLQETKTEDAAFPLIELQAAGYQAVYCGQKAYNGVAILARSTPQQVQHGIPNFPDDPKRVIAATVNELRLVCVKQDLEKYPNLAVLGDLNIAPDDRDVHDPKRWAGQIHVSEPERAALRSVVDVGLVDAFRLFEQPDKEFSWWDYRLAAFQRNWGLRIDHILLAPQLAKRCVACTIDKSPRKLERPSDHAPVIADLQ